ncbi:MAG: hypothetical protein LC732_09905, partial [Acidobacteria bacterium]|nr:hypothetical protein [Acidobacteriota bacterium]
VLLLVPSFSVAQPLAWSPEKPLTNRTLVPGGGFRIDVASDGEGWFVVWTRGSDVAGTHVRADGSAGSPVATRFGPVTWGDPAVVWHRDRYLVVWDETPLMGQWVSRTGKKIGEPLVIPAGFTGDVIAVSNGSEVLLTGRFSRTITILQRDGSTVLLEAESLGMQISAVASDGESFLVVGRDLDTSAVAIARLSPSGEVRDSRVLPLNLFGELETAWNGSEYAIMGKPIQGRPIVLVVSREGVLQSQGELSGSPAGVTLLLEPMGRGSLVAGWRSPQQSLRLVELGPIGDMEPVDLGIATSEVALAAASNELLVVWNEDGALRHQRLDRDFLPLNHPAFTTWTVPVQTSPAVTATDTGYFAAWQTRGGIVAARIGAGGARGVWPVAQSNATQIAPVLASSGDVVLLAWTEQFGHPGIFFRIFSAEGLPLQLDPTHIDSAEVHWSGGSAPNESLIAATWTGSVFVIAWPENLEILWVRVTREGVVLDSEPLRIEAARCIIGTCPPPLPPPRIEAVRLNREGHRIDDHPLIVTGYETEGQHAPEVASDGSSFLVTYTDAAERLIRGTFVTRGGGISAPIELTGAGFQQMSEELVHRQGEYLLFWRDFVPEGEAAIVVTAVGVDGEVRWSERLAEAETFGWGYPNGAAAVGNDGSVLVIYSRVDEAVGLAPHLWFRGVGLLEEQGRRRAVSRTSTFP